MIKGLLAINIALFTFTSIHLQASDKNNQDFNCEFELLAQQRFENKLAEVKKEAVEIALLNFETLVTRVTDKKFNKPQLNTLQTAFLAAVESIPLSDALSYESLRPHTTSAAAKELVRDFWFSFSFKEKDDFLNSLTGELSKILAQNGRSLHTLIEILNSKNPQPERKLGYFENKTGNAINTNPLDLYDLSRAVDFKPGKVFVDMGSGHGVPSIVLGSLNPELKFINYESVKSKVRGTQSLVKKLRMTSQIKTKKADIYSEAFKVPQADYYYFYNRQSRANIELVIRKIIAKNPGRTVTVIGYLRKNAAWALYALGYGVPKLIPGTISMYKVVLEIPETQG